VIYQHATRDRDRAIAEALGALVREVGRNPAKRRGSSQNAASVRHEIVGVWHVCGMNPARTASAAGADGWDTGPDLGRDSASGRRESNPHDQLGSL
jgi:hypothetical protein